MTIKKIEFDGKEFRLPVTKFETENKDDYVRVVDEIREVSEETGYKHDAFGRQVSTNYELYFNIWKNDEVIAKIKKSDCNIYYRGRNEIEKISNEKRQKKSLR